MRKITFNILFFGIVVPSKIIDIYLIYPEKFTMFFSDPIKNIIYNIDNIIQFATLGYSPAISLIILIIISLFRFKSIGMSKWYSLTLWIPLWNIYIIYKLISSNIIIKNENQIPPINNIENNTELKNKSNDNNLNDNNFVYYLIDNIHIIATGIILTIIIITSILFSNDNLNLNSNSYDEEKINTIIENSNNTISEINNYINIICEKGFYKIGNDCKSYDDYDKNIIYIDKQKLLMWQVIPEISNSGRDEANKIANNSNLLGYSDWRLPSSNEIHSLYNCSSNYKCSPKNVINNKYIGYWTSSDTSYEFYGYNGKMYFKSDEGIFPGMEMYSKGGVRLVRDL
ncbi:MAG: DUF1566 domain-containing protein [Candidatus Gracilibacteria bacterium]|nr:DUF1566 domain-containing protein [Candidatus Gracilibacteria bacterium]